MDLGIRDKVALVTGASRGLGRAIALGLADEGCHVSIAARGAEAITATAGEIKARGVRALPIVSDLTEPSAPADAVARTVAELGGIDILINNVGGTRGTWTLTDDTVEDWHATLGVNLIPALTASLAAIPHMRANGWGRIILITSIYGRESGGPPAYNAAKSAMNSLATSMGRELAADGIRVNAVAPGSISFPGGAWARRSEEDPEGIAEFVRRDMPLGRFGTPEELANVVVFLASERASLVNAASIAVDGGQSRSNI